MPQPTLLAITHGENDRLGRAETPLRHAGLQIDVRKGSDLPDSLDGYAGLLVMGGPGAAFEDSDEFPTRRRELGLVTEALEEGLPYLGICLGAQLLAECIGGAGYEDLPESGWYPIEVSAAARRWDPLFHDVSPTLFVMQNHTRHYELPPERLGGAEVLASGTMYYNQAFRYDNAWGLQFHLEADHTMRFPKGMDDRKAFDTVGATAYAVFARWGRMVTSAARPS